MSGSGEGLELSERQKDWLRHIQGWKKSGGPMRAYAEAQGLDVRDFYYWKRFLDEKGLLRQAPPEEVPTFQRLVVEQAMAPVCRVEFPNGVRIELTGPLNATTLGLVFKAVGAMP